MSLIWLDPNKCRPPHRITHPEKYDDLRDEFRRRGEWGKGYPALLGYRRSPLGLIQLLTGSHRWAAAKAAGIKIPVAVHPYEYVSKAFGDLERWYFLIQDVPVVK